MDEQSSMLYADRMKLIVATMTKNYDKAIEIGKSILISEPDDITLKKYLSALKSQADKMELNHCESDMNDSDSEFSDDSSTDDTSSDSKSDGSCQEIDDNNNGKIHGLIEPKELCREFNVKKKPFDYRRIEKTSRDPSCKDQGSKDNEFKGKIIRVLPIKLRRINK